MYHQIHVRVSNCCSQSSLSWVQWSSAPYKRPMSFSGADPTVQKWNQQWKSVSRRWNTNYARAYSVGQYFRHHQARGGWLLNRSKLSWGWRSGGALGRRSPPYQLAENEIAAVLGPALLDNTLNTTRPNADDPLTDESSSENDALATHPRRSTRQKKPTQSTGGERNSSCVGTYPAGQHFECHQTECWWPLNRWKFIREWYSCCPPQEEHLAEEAHSELHSFQSEWWVWKPSPSTQKSAHLCRPPRVQNVPIPYTQMLSSSDPNCSFEFKGTKFWKVGR